MGGSEKRMILRFGSAGSSKDIIFILLHGSINYEFCVHIYDYMYSYSKMYSQ